MSVWIESKESKTRGMRHYVCWRHNGTRGSQKAGGDLENAKIIRNEIERKLLSGGVNTIQTRMTFGQLYDKFIKAQASHGPATLRMSKGTLSFFVQRWKQKPMDALSGLDIKNAMIDLASIYSLNGNNLRLRYLKQMLRFGVGECLTQDGVAEIFSDPFLKKKKGVKVYRFLKEGEIKTLLFTAYDYNPEMCDIIKFFLGTLMRLGEVLGCIRGEGTQTGVTREMVDSERAIYLDETKSDNDRIIVLNDELWPIVNRVEHGKIFRDWTRDRFHHAFDLVWERTKIGGRMRPHDLRHTGISILIKKGWTDRQIMKMSGHRTATAFAVYAHLRNEDVVEQMRKTVYNFPTPGPLLTVVGE